MVTGRRIPDFVSFFICDNILIIESSGCNLNCQSFNNEEIVLGVFKLKTKIQRVVVVALL